MRIGISGTAVNNMSGLGRLNRAVILALAQRAEDCELHVFLRAESDVRLLQEECSRHSALPLDALNFHFSAWPAAKRPYIEEYELPALCAKLNLDAYLGCDFTLPARRAAPKELVLIADMLPFTRSHTVNPLSGWWYRRGVRRALRRNAHVVCISQATLREFKRIFPHYAGAQSVVYPALTPRMLELADQQPASDYNLQVQGSLHALTDPGPFMLAVGVAGPRKNAALMARAFRHVVLEGDYRGSLVLTGGDGRFHTPAEERRLAYALVNVPGEREAERRPEIYDIGRVNDYDLSQLYRKTDLLLCLSTEEGFGYPVLEALAHGTPALVTAGSAMVEISERGIAKTELAPHIVEQRMISALAALPLLRQEAKGADMERFSVERLGDNLLELIAERKADIAPNRT